MVAAVSVVLSFSASAVVLFFVAGFTVAVHHMITSISLDWMVSNL